jgi:hypothetical protein
MRAAGCFTAVRDETPKQKKPGQLVARGKSVMQFVNACADAAEHNGCDIFFRCDSGYDYVGTFSGHTNTGHKACASFVDVNTDSDYAETTVESRDLCVPSVAPHNPGHSRNRNLVLHEADDQFRGPPPQVHRRPEIPVQ